MYGYKGFGFVLPITEFGEDEVLAIINDIAGEDFADFTEVDNSMMFGSYESPDNVVDAVFDGEEVDTSAGILIFELWSEDGDKAHFDEIGELLERLGYEGYRDFPIVKQYEIECLQ